MYIINPTEKQKIKWYKASYLEGDYLIRKFGFSPIFIDDIFIYFVETDKFKRKRDGIPMIIKIWSAIRRIRIRKVINRFKNWRRKK